MANVTNELIVPFDMTLRRVLFKGGIKSNGQPRELTVVGPLAAIVVNVQIPVTPDPILTADSHWVNWSVDGVAVTLTNTNMSVKLPDEIEFRIYKPATAAPCGIRAN